MLYEIRFLVQYVSWGYFFILTYTYIKPSAQLVWPVVGQEILNGDVGGNFQGFEFSLFLKFTFL